MHLTGNAYQETFKHWAKYFRCRDGLCTLSDRVAPQEIHNSSASFSSLPHQSLFVTYDLAPKKTPYDDTALVAHEKVITERIAQAHNISRLNLHLSGLELRLTPHDYNLGTVKHFKGVSIVFVRCDLRVTLTFT